MSGIKRYLSDNAYKAAEHSDSPGESNPFVTLSKAIAMRSDWNENDTPIINDNEMPMVKVVSKLYIDDLTFENPGFGINEDGTLAGWVGVRKRTDRKLIPSNTDMFIVTCSVIESSAIFFYDIDNNFISAYKGIVGKNICYPIPDNSATYRVQAAKVYNEIPIKLAFINSNMGVFVNNINSNPDEKENYFLINNGGLYGNSGYKYIDYQKHTWGDVVKVKGLSQDLGYTVAAVCFYDNSKTFISYLDISNFGEIVTIDESNTPENCAFIRYGSKKTKDIIFLEPITKSGYSFIVNRVLSSLNYDSIFISLPSKLYVLVGETLEIFNRSIINAFNYKNYNVQLVTISGTPKFQNKGRKWTYTPSSVETFTFKMKLVNESGIIISETQNCIIEAIAKKANPVTKKNVLMIGDSFTGQNVYPLELSRRLTQSEGTPIADHLTNLNFIGSKNIGTISPNEGWSGRDYNWFCGSESPFWNNSTSDVDFNLYMSDLISNHGSELNITTGDKIDYAIIMLGTNKANNETTIKKIWDKLIVHNSNIKILVTGRVWASPIGIGFSGGVAYNANEWGFNSRCLQYNRQLETWINKSYSNNALFVDTQCQFDSEYNFPFNTEAVNKRNAEITDRIGSDSVHPSQYGYWQIADAFYNAIHNYI